MPKRSKGKPPQPESQEVSQPPIGFVFPVAASLIALLVFRLTLAPTVTAEDSGELITAAWQFGVCHPPGYPLWTLLCGAFTHLVPIGSIAFRANLFSAVCSSLTVGIVCCALYEIRISRPIAASAALLWVFSRWSWSQSVITEVYALNSLLIAGILWGALRWMRTRRPRLLLLACLLLGLGMSNHHIIGLPALALIIWILLHEPSLLTRWKLVAAGFGLFVVGLLPYAYLPIRASAEPPMNWSNPSNFQRFWEHVSRHQYGAFGPRKVHEPRSVGRFVEQSEYLVGAMVDDLTPWVAGFGFVAMFALAVRNRRLLWLAVLWLLCTGLLFILMANYDLDAVGRWSTRVFLIPVNLGLVIAVAGGLQLLTDAFRQKFGKKAAVPVLLGSALMGPILVVSTHWKNCDYSNYWYAYDHGRNLLNCMESNALVFGSNDHTTFALTYLTMVERLQPDVVVADIYGFVRPELLRDYPPAAKESEVAWLIRSGGRPTYFAMKAGSPLPDRQFVPAGMLYCLAPRGRFDGEGLMANCAYRNLDDPSVLDSGALYILCEYAYFSGLEDLVAGRRKEAIAHFDEAASLRPRVKELFNNIGSALAENRLPQEALPHFRKAASLDSHYLVPRWNLVKLNRHLGRPDAARRRLEEIFQITPGDPRPYREMGLLVHHDLKDPRGAMRWWRESLRRDPRQADLVDLLERATLP